MKQIILFAFLLIPVFALTQNIHVSYGPQDTARGKNIFSQRAINDSLLMNQRIPALGLALYGKKIVWVGDSYPFGSGASSNLKRFSTLFTVYVGGIEVNNSVAGTTLELQNPKNYQGATALTQTASTVIPTFDYSYGFLWICISLNDIGQTTGDYTTVHFSAAGDSLMNVAINTKGWPRNRVGIVGTPWIGAAGLAQYATITGGAAPTYTRFAQFDSCLYDLARRWSQKGVSEVVYAHTFNYIKTNDTTLQAGSPSGPIHMGDSAQAYFASLLEMKTGVQHYISNTTTAVFQTLTDGTTITWDVTLGKKAKVTLGGNRVLNITGMTAGDIYDLEVVQDGTGNRTLAPPGNTFSNTGVFTVNAAAGAMTLLHIMYDGVNFLCDFQNLTAATAITPANTFVNELISLGYTPGGTETTAYTTFYNSAVTHGYWSKIIAFYPFSGTTKSTQSVNFIRPTTSSTDFYGSWVGTTTNDATGWSGSTTGYFNTNLNPNTSLVFTSAALTVWATNSGSTANQGNGAYNNGTPTAGYFGMNLNYNGTQSAFAIGGNDVLINISNPAFNQCLTLSRTANNAITLYGNGSSLGTSSSTTATALPAFNTFIGALDAFGSANTINNSQHYIFAVITTGLTSGDALNLYNDLNALKTGQGR